MHREYILLNCFRKAKKGFTAGFHVPLMAFVLVKCSCRMLYRQQGVVYGLSERPFEFPASDYTVTMKVISGP